MRGYLRPYPKHFKDDGYSPSFYPKQPDKLASKVKVPEVRSRYRRRGRDQVVVIIKADRAFTSFSNRWGGVILEEMQTTTFLEKFELAPKGILLDGTKSKKCV